jgi:Methyltransferase domain
MTKELYSREFYSDTSDGSYCSASVILPLVLEQKNIRSIVDFGCGLGTWLKVAAERGISDYLGLEGEWVDDDMFWIPKEKIRHIDLAKPINLHRQFDLAMCLEVAEHLPAACADNLIDSITSAAPLVLFSAAIPLQAGSGHINVQWQDYWAELFAKRNFAAVDSIRPLVWNNPSVQWWYQQNVLLFSKQNSTFEQLRSLNMVHPQLVKELVIWFENQYGNQITM